MLAIPPLGFGRADEKRNHLCWEPLAMDNEVLTIKLVPIDGLAIGAIMACEVTTLVHTSQNQSVKAESFNTKSLLPSAQGRKVFCCLWNFVCKQLEGDMAQGLASKVMLKNKVVLTIARHGQLWRSSVCKALVPLCLTIPLFRASLDYS
ncbi:hypothetical protein mRhiFer1_008742 [Rhinolophus ferrumequinum]|uniref:Uncharacterized protein n=1 Tax=Rhinolophus ferrumequinum TaxID=59479 RepID=A0A7J7TN56_RHIFE|nr:hypothetical protein mRhiFer1_008742 [Rhinolophus ferrumequinum]